MAETQKKIYEFKIVLGEVVPTIWRQIQVPEDYNFEELSDAILSAMGWFGSHLHHFQIKNPRTGKKDIIGKKPDSDEWCFTTVWEKQAMICDYFRLNDKKKAIYIYSIGGGGWMHEVQLLKIEAADPNIEYPKCVSGAGACPVEDCGGSSCYMDLLALREKENPTEEEKERLEYSNIDEDFDPEKFNPEEVNFSMIKMFQGENERCCVS